MAERAAKRNKALTVDSTSLAIPMTASENTVGDARRAGPGTARRSTQATRPLRFAKLLRSAKALSVVFLTGGLVADDGLRASMEEAAVKAKIQYVEIRTHKDSAYAGALGAALWGGYRAERLRRREVA